MITESQKNDMISADLLKGRIRQLEDVDNSNKPAVRFNDRQIEVVTVCITAATSAQPGKLHRMSRTVHLLQGVVDRRRRGCSIGVGGHHTHDAAPARI